MYVVAIVGSRDFKNKTLLNNEMQKVLSIYPIKKVISGGAKGADTLGIQWARKNDIEAEVYATDFKNRKHAHQFRDRQIIQDSDIVVAFWNGYSTGTKYTINYAKTLEKNVIVIKV